MTDAKKTTLACYASLLTQAVVINLSPLLYAIFNFKLGLSAATIALLSTLTFALQMAVDALFSPLIYKIGYKTTALMADGFGALGLILLGLSPFIGGGTLIIIGILTGSIGSAMIEVVASPLLEALPGDKKSASMSLLHSFYCWGHLFVVLFATAFFFFFGEDYWFILPFIMVIVPLINAALFFSIKKITTLEEGGASNKFSSFGKNKYFVMLAVLMICAGASEQGIAQWASYFAEVGLGVKKSFGDLLGTSMFALFMALARTFFGFKGHKLNLEKSLAFCGAGLTFSYLLAALSPVPVLSLIGVALCGLFVGITWPGTLSLSGDSGLCGGTLMFALLALGGDIGCTLGPAVVGGINTATGNLNLAILAGTIFPIILTVTALIYFFCRKKDAQKQTPLKSN